jgi:class 3 adenylate cyclase
MFVDFVGFTKIAEQLSPEVLVEALDHCFSQFDTIIGRYQIEKIKTVGDAYICASGLSDRNDYPTEMIKAALQMQAFLQQFELKHGDQRFQFNARIGIHYGPVVAGIVGTKKFAYDIWGDTVNIASRLESSGEPSKVNISGTTFELIKDKFNCQHRGKIEAKNKGEIDMYFVEQL